MSDTVNIAAPLSHMAESRPEQLAVSVPTSREPSGRTIYQSYSYRQLHEESDILAAGLAAMGIGRGMRTVLMVPPSLEFFALTFALFKAGAVPVFVDPGMGLKNLGQCLAEAEPEAFIGVTKAHIARRLFGWGRSTIQQTIAVSWKFGLAQTSLRDVRVMGSQARSVPFASPETRADDVAAILFTSGSTGVPKGAVYTHGNFMSQIDALRIVFRIEPGEVDLCTFPLFALFAPALGMTAIVPRMDFTQPARVEPREVEEPIERFGINNLFGSPALLNRVSREHLAPGRPRPGGVQWPTLKRVLSAGAPVSPAILERVQQRLAPGTQIYTPYGATEALPVAVIGSDEVLSDMRHRTAAGAGTCVGRPVAGIDVRIIRISDEPIAGWSDDLVLPVGQIGEIAVFGPQVTQAYFHRDDLTSLAKIPDAVRGRKWHRMGDVGYFDEQGRLWFCGRKSQRVITTAGTHFTDTVEGVFNAHPQVFRSALVGVLRNGEREPVICIERDSPYERPEAELTADLLVLAQQFEVTRAMRTFLYHPSFPVDIRHNSKIFREKLAVWAARRLNGASF